MATTVVPSAATAETFEDAFAQRNTGAVFAWAPGEKAFRMLPGTELSANNGIETSPDDREFYVASTPTRRIYAFSRAEPGAGPLRFAQLKDFGPDNVRWTAGNRLITAGLIDDEPACGGRPKDEQGIRCPMGYAVATIDPGTMAATEIARGARTPAFTGTAMAAVGLNTNFAVFKGVGFKPFVVGMAGALAVGGVGMILAIFLGRFVHLT